jgi:hypothetical protein
MTSGQLLQQQLPILLLDLVLQVNPQAQVLQVIKQVHQQAQQHT